jgi:hypothetical protein
MIAQYLLASVKKLKDKGYFIKERLKGYKKRREKLFCF